MCKGFSRTGSLVLIMLFVVFASMTLMAASQSSLDFDLRRAKTRKPRAQYQGHGSVASANAQLNQHLLARKGLRTKACELHSREDLRDILRQLWKARDTELLKAYPKDDGRHSVYTSEQGMEAHWASLPADENNRQRDAHCHEAVMWFVHHLNSQAQAAFDHILPLLPQQDHPQNPQDASTKFYASKVTCQKCHVGGIDNLGVPEVKPTTAQAIARRCYTNYKELFNLTCGPCDGISGIYWGDDDAYFSAPPCEVVAKPEDVPQSERVPPKLPHQFTVDVKGSDRFGRTTNPSHSNIIEKLYGQIEGKWYMNVIPGVDQWFLRHDTTYTSISLDGKHIPLFTSASVSEIHVQNRAQKKANVTGPMVSLISGLPSWIPGGCTCIPDPVGVPDITASEATGLDNMEYMGRIKLDPIEYLNKTIELDHWANWFFHIFMETDKNSEMYGQAPRRLASAYAGMAVYQNWKVGDPNITDPTVWYRGIPTSPEKVGPDHGKYCMNPKKAAFCDNISQTTFPPPSQTPSQGGVTVGTKHQLAPHFFPIQSRLGEIYSMHANKLSGTHQLFV